MIFTFALAADGGSNRVHKLDGDEFTGGREGTGIDRTKSTVTEDIGERVRCAAEEGVGEGMRRVGV